MADAKITALTNRGRDVVAPSDPTVVVDVSDTTMDATGTNVKVTVGEFVAAGIPNALGKIIAVNARAFF